MQAEITYNNGRTYKLGKVKFVQGVTQVVSNPEIIHRCQCTVGFAVQILESKKPKKRSTPEKIVRDVVETEYAAPKKKKGATKGF